MSAAAVSAVNVYDADRVAHPVKQTVDDAGRYLPHHVKDECINIGAAIVESVAVAASNARSGALTKTDVILIASTDCFVLAGSGSPTAAAATSYPLKAFTPMRVKMTSGHKIAVIRSTADGVLNIFDPA